MSEDLWATLTRQVAENKAAKSGKRKKKPSRMKTEPVRHDTPVYPQSPWTPLNDVAVFHVITCQCCGAEHIAPAGEKLLTRYQHRNGTIWELEKEKLPAHAPLPLAKRFVEKQSTYCHLCIVERDQSDRQLTLDLEASITHLIEKVPDGKGGKEEVNRGVLNINALFAGTSPAHARAIKSLTRIPGNLPLEEEN